MHIKQVFIKNFRSYKDLSEFTPFSPKNNVIVGRNGAGKSNFFHAVQFVLSDLYSNLRPEEKQALLHEGATGETVMQAYVEIVFDNRDGRIPIDKEDVVLRRTIGLKKDEYYLDKKHVSKNDVINLLESAGFSRSNPYYIVQQGKVNALAIMKDSERLELLKEVAGTHVYDERRTESEKIMQESSGRRQKIEELLTYINERLAELEAEKEELKEYQQLDKDRRSLEYTVYDMDLQEAVTKLGKLDAKREEASGKVAEVHDDAAGTREQLKAAERDLKNLSTELLRLTKEKEALETDQHAILKQRAKLQLDVSDFQERSKNREENTEKLKSELASVEKELNKAEKELRSVIPEYEKLLAEESKVRVQVAEAEQKLAQLFAKQGRTAQFSSKEQRDKWLRGEMGQVEKVLNAKQEQIAALEADVKKMREKLAEGSKELAAKQKEYDERLPHLETAIKQAAELKEKRDSEANERKELWRKDSEMDANVQTCRNELAKYERQLQSSVNKVVAAGVSAVMQLAAEKHIAGVHGPLIDLFEVPEKFATAVEVTAGNALFHVVVETDEVASRLLELLNEQQVGRVTFMPLNRLNVRDPEPIPSSDALPLIKHIKYNAHHEKALKHVFGKTLLCRSLEVATSFAKTYNRNCVTLDGDQINKRGSMTGGFVDTRTSRLEAKRNIHKWRGQLDALDKEAGKLKEQITALDTSITKTLAEHQKTEARKEQTRNTMDQLQLDLRATQQAIDGARQAVEGKDKQLAELKLSHRQMETSLAAMKAELGSPLTDKLNAKEQQEQTRLNEQLTELHRDILIATTARSEKEARKTTLENQLASNFKKRRDQLQESLARAQVVEASTQLEAAQVELRLASEGLGAAKSRAKELDGKIDANSARVLELRKVVDDLKAADNERTKQIQSQSKNMEKILNKRSLMLQQRDECLRKIRDLGALPAEAFERFRGVERTRLLKNLHATNEKLKGYSHVNKKALDQYVTFTEQRTQLAQRKEELDTGEESIKELIAVLDQRKDEAIERTFKGVAKHFSEVFEDLVPGGKASLVMLVKKDVQGHEQEEGARIRTYSGVAIRVAFTHGEETRMIQQLSGGQKSLVALAFIFAIQRCDRAPFYLFDEIDSALDPTHRAAVARLVEREAKSCQIIAVTFRPELVQVAKQTYEVRADNKQSKVVPIEPEEALEIIEATDKEAAEEEQKARGDQ